MAFLTAALTLGAAGLSARASRQAGDKASDAARQASGDIRAAADQARTDVLDLTPQAERKLIAGSSAAFDILGQGIGAQQRAISQGNLNAQQTVGGGFNQVQNALLGLPVNTQGFAPQGVDFTQTPANPFFVQGPSSAPGSIQAPGSIPPAGSGGFPDNRLGSQPRGTTVNGVGGTTAAQEQAVRDQLPFNTPQHVIRTILDQQGGIPTQQQITGQAATIGAPQPQGFHDPRQIGMIGGNTLFQTGQGATTGSTGVRGMSNIGSAIPGQRAPVLNDFASLADSLGKLKRNPDGSTSFDFSASQTPGSAAITSGDASFKAYQKARTKRPSRRTDEEQKIVDDFENIG